MTIKEEILRNSELLDENRETKDIIKASILAFLVGTGFAGKLWHDNKAKFAVNKEFNEVAKVVETKYPKEMRSLEADPDAFRKFLTYEEQARADKTSKDLIEAVGQGDKERAEIDKKQLAAFLSLGITRYNAKYNAGFNK